MADTIDCGGMCPLCSQFLPGHVPSCPIEIIAQILDGTGDTKAAEHIRSPRFVMDYCAREVEADTRIENEHDGHPCTCTDSCSPQCKGTCGCKACQASYRDFLSGE